MAPITVGLLACDTSGGRQNYIADMDHWLSRFSLDVLLLPEYANQPFSEVQNLSERHSRTLLIPGTSFVRSGHKLFNTAQVFLNGQVIHNYYKQSLCVIEPFGESYNCPPELRTGACFAKGDSNSNAGIFRWNNLYVGVEICSDHTYGHGTRSSPKPVLASSRLGLDLQFIPSYGLESISNLGVATKSAGYIFLVDGFAHQASIPFVVRAQRNNGTTIKPMGYRKNNFDKHYLAVYSNLAI